MTDPDKAAVVAVLKAAQDVVDARAVVPHGGIEDRMIADLREALSACAPERFV